jgi:hypothetical protein
MLGFLKERIKHYLTFSIGVQNNHKTSTDERKLFTESVS